MPDESHEHRPTMPSEYVDRVREWHERAYTDLRHREQVDIDFLGLRLAVPQDVFPPTPLSDMLGRIVLDETEPSDRVLDMGTGSGSNALLAATISRDVLAVDINPAAVACARRNAEANGLADRVEVRESDVFDHVDGRFDLIVLDPPFRWFPPRDMLEAAITDEDYRALTRFMTEVADRLTQRGRVLVFFGTSGDLDHLHALIEETGLSREVLDRRGLDKDGWHVDYYVYRLRTTAP